MLNRKLEDSSIVFYSGTARVLTIKEEEAENGILITLIGELRSETANELGDELTMLATVGASIVLDFEGVTYIAPNVLGKLLTVQRSMDSMKKGTLLLRRLKPDIYSQFEKHGMSELLDIQK